MDTSKSVKLVSGKIQPVKRDPGEELCLPPWLFRHNDLIMAIEDAREVDRESLANILNHIHFTDGKVLVHLRHPKYDESIIVRAFPDVCNGKDLICRWQEESRSDLRLKDYQFLHLIIDDGRSMTLVPATLKKIDRFGFAIQLPDKSFAVGDRAAMRYKCHGIMAELVQSGFISKGELLDFSPNGFRIKARPEPSCSFNWFNSEEPVTINLRNNNQVLFSEMCRCIRQEGNSNEREIVLEPVEKKINRFKKKEFRNPRQRLLPSPTLVFDHPFFKKRIQLEVFNISTAGFSVSENSDICALMPGMIIPGMTINFAGFLKIKCVAQVIYRIEKEEKTVRYGLAILDMNINSYSQLTHILTNALEPNAYIFSEVDMAALWEFFFDTGFIYPKKYGLIQSSRKDFESTYKKLYQESPEIGKHFTCQKNSRIYGHISMIRAYERAWMIHHHAARAMDGKRAGFIVLKQLLHYLNDMYRLPSAKIDHIICYFRPENKFPDRVFGGFTRHIENPQACSMDLFSYLTYTNLSLKTQLPYDWSLDECSQIDLWNLKRFYNEHSGGLLMDALGLDQEDGNNESIEDLYARFGLLRKLKTFTLKQEGKMTAVLIVNHSDMGLNLSELLNGIKILIVDSDGPPWNILSIAIAQLTKRYNMERVPIMFFPVDYVKANNIPSEKQYQLWVMNVKYGNEYLRYMQKKFRISF